MSDLYLLITFWLVIAFAITYLAYVFLVDAATDWLANNDVLFLDYPWYVRLNYWIYHREVCRVQNVLFSLCDAYGARVLSMLVRDGACMHIVGLANRKPTDEELVVLEPLLAELNFTLSYVGPHMGQR